MRPTKRTKARKVKGSPALDKLMKLKYRINDAYKAGRSHFISSSAEMSDKTWVMEEITNLRQGGWLTASKMKVANEMWNKYGG